MRQLFSRRASKTYETYIYPIGAGGIGRPVNLGSIKSTGAPLLDLFMGIPTDDGDLPNNEQGWARAYKGSATAFRCIQVRSQTLASIPLRVVDVNGDDFTGHPLSAALNESNTNLIYTTENDMQVFGRAFWSYGMNRNLPGIATIKRLNPQTMELIADVGGIRGFKQVINGITIREWEAHEIVYFNTYDPDNDVGFVSPMARALRSVGITINISIFGEYFFKNGAMPDGILVADRIIPEADKARILAEWKRNFQGVDNAHATALLDGPPGSRITYQPLTPPIKDLAMPELRESESYQIAQAFGVPPTMAMITNASNFATADSERKSLYTETVLPELDFILDAINRQLVPRYGIPNVKIEADTSNVEVLQEDRGEITQRAGQGVSAGYLSLNDAREMEDRDGLKTDYFIIGGKLVPRPLLEAGDYGALRELGVLGQPEPVAPSFPFGAIPPRSTEQPVVIENPPQKALVDIRVHAPDSDTAQRVTEAVVADTMHRDLKRWRKKIASKGVHIPFDPDYLPDALAAFLRADVRGWDGETDVETWIDTAFERATKAVDGLVKQDDASATPEEFEAFWRGIDGLFDDVGEVFEQQFAALQERLAAALRESGDTFDIETFLSEQLPVMVEALTGTEDNPGAFTRVYLAGAARGNDIVTGVTKQAALTIDWEIINKAALEWARQFAGEKITGINATTRDIFRQKMVEWMESGGTLEQFADFIEGTLPQLDMPPGWSPGKLQWATSRSRARLIAQTETTSAFTQGNYDRWQQLGLNNVQWRTQRDSDVDDEICKPLHGVMGTIGGGFIHPKTGRVYFIPAHPGCRCFPRPVTGNV